VTDGPQIVRPAAPQAHEDVARQLLDDLHPVRPEAEQHGAGLAGADGQHVVRAAAPQATEVLRPPGRQRRELAAVAVKHGPALADDPEIARAAAQDRLQVAEGPARNQLPGPLSAAE